MRMYQLTPSEIEVLRGSRVYHKQYVEYGRNVSFETVTILGWTKSRKRVRILDCGTVRNVPVTSLYETVEAAAGGAA